MNLPARLTSLEMILYDVLYISYLLPSDRVRPLVPSHLALDTVDDEHVFLSVVMSFVREAKAARLPSPRFTYYQVHVCTYVKHPHTGEHATYHLHGAMTVMGAVRLARFMGMRVDFADFRITPDRDERLRYRGYRMEGSWLGTVEVEADEIAPRLDSLAPFASPSEAVIYFTDALVTLFGGEGKVREMAVWHPRFQPRVARVTKIAMPVLRHLGVLDAQDVARPHNVLLVPRAHWLFHLPSRRLR